MGGLQLRLGGVDLRLGGLQRLRGLIVVGARGPALLEQRVLALEVVAGLRQLALGGRRLACAARRALSSFCGSRRATAGRPAPGRPSEVLSSSRPEMRKARVTSSSASMRPVRMTGRPAVRLSIVRVRTGRGSSATFSASWPHPASRAAARDKTAAIRATDPRAVSFAIPLRLSLQYLCASHLAVMLQSSYRAEPRQHPADSPDRKAWGFVGVSCSLERAEGGAEDNDDEQRQDGSDDGDHHDVEVALAVRQAAHGEKLTTAPLCGRLSSVPAEIVATRWRSAGSIFSSPARRR